MADPLDTAWANLGKLLGGQAIHGFTLVGIKVAQLNVINDFPNTSSMLTLG